MLKKLMLNRCKINFLMQNHNAFDFKNQLKDKRIKLNEK